MGCKNIGIRKSEFVAKILLFFKQRYEIESCWFIFHVSFPLTPERVKYRMTNIKSFGILVTIELYNITHFLQYLAALNLIYFTKITRK